MNTKKILGIIAALMLVAVALVGAGAATDLDGADASTGSGANVTYYTAAELEDAINAGTPPFNGEDVIVTVLKNFSTTDPITVSHSIEFTADSAKTITLGNTLGVATGKTLTLGTGVTLVIDENMVTCTGTGAVVGNVVAVPTTEAKLRAALKSNVDVDITLGANVNITTPITVAKGIKTIKAGTVANRDTITFGTSNLTIGTGGKLVVGEGVKLTFSTGNITTTNGTLVNYGLIVKGTAPTPSTASTIFFYEKNLNGRTTVAAGTTFSDLNGHTFTIPADTDAYLEPSEKVVAGTYYEDGKTDTGSDVLYLREAGVETKNISKTSVAIDEIESFDVSYTCAAGLKPDLIFSKDGKVFVESIGGIQKNFTDGKFTVFPTEKGVWGVYADFTNVANILDAATPIEYKYALLGYVEVVKSAADKTAVLTLSQDEVAEDDIFYLTVVGPETTGTYAVNNCVTVEYYTDDADDTTEIKNNSDIIQFVPKQKGAEQGVDTQYFGIDATGILNIGLVAKNIGFTGKDYTIVVTIPGVCDVGSTDKTKFEVALKTIGNTMTAKADAAYYYFGQTVGLNGTYNKSMPLYFYVEGSNVAFKALGTNGELAGWDKTKKTGFDNSKEDVWQAGIEADEFAGFNPGIYTVYVSSKQGDVTTEKEAIVKNAKVVNVDLRVPMIEITDAKKEVEQGKLAKFTVTQYGTEKAALYIVGQNKLFYADPEVTAIKAADFNKLKNWLDDYVYEKEDVTLSTTSGVAGTAVEDLNAFVELAIDGKATLYAVKKNAGPTYVDVSSFPLGGTFYKQANVLKVKEETDVYTYYVATKAITTAFNESTLNDEFALGQYYVVAQHPMADGIFSTEAKVYSVKNVYKSGYDIITNGAVKFNIPSLQNVEAAQALISAIKEGNDGYAGETFFIVAEADAAETISGVQTSYNQGDVITIVVDNSDDDKVYGTLEANEFEFNAANINYIQTFAAKTDETSSPYKWTLTLDTTGVPAGDYNIVLKDSTDKVIKVFATKVVGGAVGPVTPVDPVEPVEPVDPVNPPAPATPGFGILAALAGLGAVAVLVLRRK